MHNRLIIFDCFGVIFGEVAPVFLRRHLPAEKVDSIKDKLFEPADLGKVTYDELIRNMSLELGISEEEIIPEWESLFVINEKMPDVIRELRKSADIALLSNAPLGVVEGLIEKHNLHGLFDKTCISCNIGMAKPDPEIYRYCVSQFDGEYEKIYMIDDNLKNLEPLSSLGITPVHFKGIDSMLELLK